MKLHIDGSKHRWLNNGRWHDLIVILDDASSQIYYASQLGNYCFQLAVLLLEMPQSLGVVVPAARH